MKRFAAMLAVVGLVASTGFAGTVTFDPAEIMVDPGTQTVDVQVFVSTDGGGTISSADLVVGSADLTVQSFVYDPAFVSGTAFRTDPPIPVGIFTNDIFFGGFATAPFDSPLLMGTLTLALPQVAAGTDGRFEYFVDSVADGGFSNVNGVEGAAGTGAIIVVPEPATLCLLGLGAVGLIRRRFA